jgi:hypothetical protein
MSEDKVLQLRHNYLSCHKLARETDSKKEDAYLKSEAGKALEELRKLCPHKQTVCLQSEHEGFQSMDYDDAHQERRICLCCGESESAWNPDWKILTTIPFARFEQDSPIQIRNPLSFLLTELVEIAETKGYHYSGSVKLREDSPWHPNNQKSK